MVILNKSFISKRLNSFNKQFGDLPFSSGGAYYGKFRNTKPFKRMEKFLTSILYEFADEIRLKEIKVLSFSGDKPSDYAQGQMEGYNSAKADLDKRISDELGK